MRLMNHPIGVPFETIHWNNLRIPLVVSHHMIIAERHYFQKRKPPSELKYSMKHMDYASIRSVQRFLGAVDDMIDAGEIGTLINMGAVGKLKVLLLEDDLKMVFETQTSVIKGVINDRGMLFSRELIEGPGLDIILDLMDLKVHDEDPERKMVIDHYQQMIRANSTYVLGTLIGNGLQERIMNPAIVDILLDKTMEEDPAERSNALFCFRMALESDRNLFMDYQRTYNRALEMLDDEEGVVEEALRLIRVCLEQDLIEGEDIAVESMTFEELSRREYANYSVVARAILSSLESRDLVLRGD